MLGLGVSVVSDAERYPGGNGITSGSMSYHTSLKILTHDRMSMVEDSVSNGKRIAQLLASELTGLEGGLLATVTVADASPDAVPDEAGTEAYRLLVDGEPVAIVTMFPEAAQVSWTGGVYVRWTAFELPESAGRSDGLDFAGDDVVVRSGAAVKPAVDVIRAVLDDHADDLTGDAGE